MFPINLPNVLTVARILLVRAGGEHAAEVRDLGIEPVLAVVNDEPGAHLGMGSHEGACQRRRLRAPQGRPVRLRPAPAL